MRYLEDVKEMLCRELEEISQSGRINSSAELEAIDKLTHSIKSIETIMAMQGYSGDDGSYRGSYRGSYDNGSYARRRDSRGRYMSNDNGYSGRMYEPYYGGHSWRGYSRADAKEDMMETMREAMNNASSEETKEAIKKAMQLMEKE